MATITKAEIIAGLAAQRAVPLFTCTEADAGMAVLRCLHDAGLKIVEFTNRNPAALDVFAEMVIRAAEAFPGMILGAGTIIDVAQAEAFHGAGASFLVAPHLDEEVGRWCAGRDLAWCPGTGTVTEMVRADRLGAAVVKVFPADALGGPAFLKAVRGPCPWLRLMPSSGVTAEPANLAGWFAAGAHCVGIGSQLIDPKEVAAGRFDDLASRARKLVAALPGD
jgi:2-dehydro-3-deoxyphosphogluconate aldolase/(4S)-4-hydroxy-2-oxoglutarate aldolase